MVAPAIIAAGISAAAAIGSSVKASNDASSATSGSAARALDFYKMQQQTSGAHLPYLVDNAKAAGLHPLFALGTSSNYTPSFGTQGGGGKSGSYIGEGIAQAGRAVGKGVMQASQNKANAEIHDLRLQKMRKEIALDDMEILKRASDLKMAEQNPMWGDTDTGLGSETKIYPFGTKSGPPLNMRPLTAMGRQSIPKYVEQVGPKGRRKIINPELGMDETGQAHWLIDPYEQYLRAMYSRKFLPNRDRIDERGLRAYQKHYRRR